MRGAKSHTSKGAIGRASTLSSRWKKTSAPIANLRSNRWALRALEARRRPELALFAILQGGTFPHLRRRAAERAQALYAYDTAIQYLQTALDLIARGKEVFVVAEAVGSRRPEGKALALERLRQHGAQIVSREMVAFEWLHRAGNDRFRQISREFIR